MEPVSTTKKAATAADKPPRKKTSGPSGKHLQAGYLLRESEPGQLDAWRAEASKHGLGLGAWIRSVLDAALARSRSPRR